MTKTLTILITFMTLVGYSQTATQIANSINNPASVSNPTVLLGVNPVPSSLFKPYIKNDIRWETYNINNFTTAVQGIGDVRYKGLNYTPNYSEVTTALGFVPPNPNGTNLQYIAGDGTKISFPSIPASQVRSDWNAVSGVSVIDNKPTDLNQFTNSPGFITGFTEVDPNVPSYSKSLTSFSVVQISTDLLYEPIFSKNTAFNKNFGVSSNTVVEGDDSRVNNGQTAFGWGNHASAGYLTSYTETDPLFDSKLATKTTANLSEGSNLYYLDSRARSAVSLTTTGQTGVSTYNSSTGVVNIPDYTVTAGTGISVASNVVTNTSPDQTVVLTGSNGITTSGTYPSFTVANTKREETYSGTTNGSGVYTVTFGTPYSVAPNIQANIINGTDTQNIRTTAISTTGFTVLVRNRVDVVGLLPSWTNVSGANVDVMITEK